MHAVNGRNSRDVKGTHHHCQFKKWLAKFPVLAAATAMIQTKGVLAVLCVRPRQGAVRPALFHNHFSAYRPAWCMRRIYARPASARLTEGRPPREGLTPRPPAACRTLGKVTCLATGLRPSVLFPRSVFADCDKPATAPARY